ncbi:UNVERIFIED_CONTAM: hypothetical protein GTU68_035560 [Idotea baltica]|nr:hypothetical protein [Idotea baltica]
MMDAKKALTEANGDAEAATQILREKGLSKAAKRSDRENADGAVALAQDGNKVAVVLLRSETDFSAKSEDFVAVAQKLADAALAVANPLFLSRDEVSEEDAAKERVALLEITKSEGKPEAAWDKIVDGRMSAWYKESVLLEQGLNGDKVSVAETAAPGSVVRFVQARVGA